MKCAGCKSGKNEVIDSRPCGSGIKRRRECECGARFTTYEVSEHDYRLLRDGRIRNNKRKKTFKNREYERNRRKVKPSPRDLLRERFPKRIADAITRGEMTEAQAILKIMEKKNEAFQRISSADTHQ